MLKGGSFAERIKIARQLKASEPQLISTDPSYKQRKLAQESLPDGAVLMPRKNSNLWTGTSFFGGQSSGGGNSTYHTQRPYMPEWDSPDRQWYPDDRLEANRYWRLFYKSDPILGTAVDMYATMMTSDFDIVIENEQDSTVRQQLLEMCEEVNFQERFQQIIREYLVLGEAFVHCFFDSTSGRWSYIGFHNPDHIDVIDAPIIDMDPMIYFVPDDDLRSLLTSNTPESYEIRSKLPAEFVSKVMARQKIRLSSLNCSYIPRKLHPYDDRGTSIASRLWRINEVEDAVYNSTISIYRRHANAIKVIKLGSEQSGWIPPESHNQKMLEMVAQAEVDPNAWIVTHYGTQFEFWGDSQRAITIRNEHDTIEKIKLTALGMSKSFMSGEITFASAKSGLQVFLRRLLSLRQHIESAWVYPKFFKPIVEINDWTKSTPAELDHRIRIKRTAQEADAKGLLLKPKIKWKNRLDSSVDSDLLQALGQLKNFGFPVSQSTAGATAGLDWENEERKKAKEFLRRKEILKKELGSTLYKEYEDQGAAAQGVKPPGAAGSGAAPGGAKPPGSKPPSTPPGNSEGGGALDDKIDAPSSGVSDTIE